jgi:hypothetical protein
MFTSEAERKLWEMVHAKTLLGKINFASDLVNEQLYPSPIRDEATHLAAELLLGRGTFTRRFIRWSGKFAKYGSKNLPNSEVTWTMLGFVPIVTAKTLGLVPVSGKTTRRSTSKRLRGNSDLKR